MPHNLFHREIPGVPATKPNLFAEQNIEDLIKPPTIPAAVVAPTPSTPVVPPTPPTPLPTPPPTFTSTSIAPTIITLPNGQRISSDDPNFEIFKAQAEAATSGDAPTAPTAPTVGETFGSLLADETPEEKALREERERIAEENRITGTTEIDEAQLRQDVMDRFQAEIDSLNALFEERKREERISGTGRLGTERAIQSRRGLLGSSFGVAGKGRVEEFNIAKLNLIAAEQQNAVQVLLGNARKIATQELKDKNEARAAGTDAFVKFLEEEVSRKAAQIDQVVNTIITRGIDIDAMSEEELDQLAKDLGVSAEQILDAVRAKLALIEEDKEPTKGVILKPGDTLLDPITGEEIGSVPAAPEDVSVPVIQKFGGNVNQWDPSTNTWKVLGTEKELGLDNFTNSDLISMAKAGLTVNAAGEIVKIAEPVNEIALAEAKEKVNLIDSLLIVDDGLDVAVGPNKGARFSPFEMFSAKRINFVAGVEQLVSKESLESLIAAKAKGATFGALSDTEMAILRSAATKIAGWRVDKDGNPVSDPSLVAGYKITEEKFLEELNLLKEKTASIIRLAELEKAEQAGATGDTTDQSNDDFFNSFDEPGGGTEPFSLDLGKSQNFLASLGEVTAFGSPLWKHGLDLDLAIGDPVPSPVSGKVEFVGENGGFGNQIRIVTAQGNSVWLSHLDSFDVKVGDQITKGQFVAKGGNTGKTIPGPSGDGSHLDLTVKKSDGTFFTPHEIHNKLV